MTPEGKVKAYLRKCCTKRDWICAPLEWPACPGWPDRVILAHSGRICFVEVKASSTKHARMHLARQAAWRRVLLGLGFLAVQVTDEKGVDALMERLEFLWTPDPSI